MKERKLILERRNLKIQKSVDEEYLIGNRTALLLMDAQQVSVNANLNDIPTENDEIWKVLRDIFCDTYTENYCYIKFHILNDVRKQYKIIHITHIVADEMVINPKVLEHIFQIIFKQEDCTLNNRMFLGNREYKFTKDSFQHAKDAAEYVFGLYVSFTNSLNPKYTFPYRPLILQ